MFEKTRHYLKSIALPEGDLNHLPSSNKQFSDGSHFKIEIPTVNSIDAMEALLDESKKLQIKINRITETYGIFRHTKSEIQEMVKLCGENIGSKMHNFNMNEKITLLRNWCYENKIAESSVKNIFDMLALGKRPDRRDTDPMQFPACYIKDTQAKPWHDPNQYDWVKTLETNFQNIKKEALAIFQSELMDVHPENDDLAGYGTWNTFFFYKNGEKNSKNLQRCPLTAKVLSEIDGIDIAGRTYFSAMTPGIHIKPHCGPHNFKLRTHLGIVTPEQATIRVGNNTRSWPEGKCIVFDDSFEHEVWNKSTEVRIVLIVDVWNPVLTQEQIKALQYIMPEFYKNAE